VEEAGLDDVPVTVFGSDDEADILEALVHANKTRDKTHEQKMREAQALAVVEEKRADQRRREGGARGGRASGASRRGEAKEVAPVPPPSDETGKTREKIADALGVGARSVDHYLTTGDCIDQLTAEGRPEDAEAFEICEDGRTPTKDELRKLFPFFPGREPLIAFIISSRGSHLLS